MIVNLDKFRIDKLKDKLSTGNTFKISVDISDLSIQGTATNKIYEYNPTILDYNDPRKFCMTTEEYSEYYKYTLSDSYIDSMPNDFIENLDKNSVKSEMNKLRDAIQSSKDIAKDMDKVNDFGEYSLEHGWNVENCAEVWGSRNAILNGANFDDIIMRTVSTDGKVKLPCKNCLNTFKDHYIVN